ncbi:MAG: HAD-IIB family hydrolase [Gammaproteobacteria bacterium]|nr:HAD-IIB family hydrolase [Gammaproteobacteria bacterium]
MNESRLLLCTDMDRTVIPNGVQAEHEMARKCFTAFCRHPQVVLVYVTGRHLDLVKQAIYTYCLPMPDYLITDVGTRIYQRDNQDWTKLSSWEEEIDKDWNGQSAQLLKTFFIDIPELRMQEQSKQNAHKLSYYVSLQSGQQNLLSEMQRRLDQAGVKASLVWSVDEPKGVGLLDILPLNATKLHAVQFLREKLSYSTEEVIFAGDSGNDLEVMGSSIFSVLVANSAKEVKESALALAAKNGTADTLHIATGNGNNMNGNYTAGVLEGVAYFFPALQQQLIQSGFELQGTTQCD